METGVQSFQHPVPRVPVADVPLAHLKSDDRMA
jgi:hypothetical protein